MPTFVGIDVGGTRKGFHCVAITDDRIEATESCRSAECVAEWCTNIGADIIGVDAPCGWSATACGRAAEREMWALAGLHSFSTPSEAKAKENAFYQWMRNGAALYRVLRPNYPLYNGKAQLKRFCFETYPHAIAWALAGRALSARDKRKNRPPLLSQRGFELAGTTSIDVIDAALCALTARYVWRQEYRCFGDSKEGCLLVPKPTDFPTNVPVETYSE